MRLEAQEALIPNTLPKGIVFMGPITMGQGQTGAIASALSRPLIPSGGSAQPAAAKKDTAIISEKAKDLAALKAGKSASEETHESMSAKAMEGDGD